MNSFRKLEVQLRYFFYCLKQINKPHLGADVRYKNKNCILIQGVQNPYWSLIEYNRDERIRHDNVHVSEFRLHNTLKSKIIAFKFHYNFLMGYWYSIDVRKGLFTRQSYA